MEETIDQDNLDVMTGKSKPMLSVSKIWSGH